MNTVSAASQRILHFTDTIPAIISRMGEQEFCHKPSPGKWSKKEILGHLVDSATNNHQRIIRTQYEQIPSISYDQNKWNELNHYNDLPANSVVNLWVVYNKHLALIITHISAGNLQLLCNTGEENPVTLEWLINDYVDHMEHHLTQITG